MAELPRPVDPGEHGAVALLAASSFARFGDYGAAVARWLGTPGMVAEVVGPRGDPHGFVLVAQIAEPAGPPRGEIVAIAVRPEARGRGFGGALLDRALLLLRRAPVPTGAVGADVAEDNAPALALFASRGFEVAGVGAAYAGGTRGVRLRRG